MNETKKAYNAALRAARSAAKAALVLREQLVASDRSYSGPSVGHLKAASESLGKAKRFAIEG